VTTSLESELSQLGQPLAVVTSPPPTTIREHGDGAGDVAERHHGTRGHQV